MTSNNPPIVSYSYEPFTNYFNATKLGGGGDTVGYGALTQLANGSFLATWETMNGYSAYNIYAQRFNSNGLKNGDNFLLASSQSAEYEPAIAAFGASGFASVIIPYFIY